MLFEGWFLQRLVAFYKYVPRADYKLAANTLPTLSRGCSRVPHSCWTAHLDMVAISPQCSPCLQVALNEETLIIQEWFNLKWYPSLTGIQYFTTKAGSKHIPCHWMQKRCYNCKFSSLMLEIVTLTLFFSKYAKGISRGSKLWAPITANCERIELRTLE